MRPVRWATMTPQWSPGRDGNVHVNKDETSTRRCRGGAAGAWSVCSSRRPSLAARSLVQPPAVGGRVEGHVADVRVGDLIDSGEAALVIVGESTIEAAIERPT